MVRDFRAIDYHARLKALFFLAVELDGEEQSLFVKSACGEDCGLRSDLESLLHHHDCCESSAASDTREP